MQFFEPQNARAVKKNKEKCLELLVLIFFLRCFSFLRALRGDSRFQPKVERMG